MKKSVKMIATVIVASIQSAALAQPIVFTGDDLAKFESKTQSLGLSQELIRNNILVQTNKKPRSVDKPHQFSFSKILYPKKSDQCIRRRTFAVGGNPRQMARVTFPAWSGQRLEFLVALGPQKSIRHAIDLRCMQQGKRRKF